MKFFRTKYKFSHPEQSEPVYFKAYSERRAKKKFYNWLVIQVHGKWALTYDSNKVNGIFDKCTCEAV